MPRQNGVVRLATLVKAAAAQCRVLRELKIPARDIDMEQPEWEGDAARLLHVVVAALPQWPHLRRLSVPMSFVNFDRNHAVVVECLTAITMSCSRMEKIDGYRPLVDHMNELTSDEQWHVDEATWKRFCASTPRLTSFEWIVVPFMTTFFEILGLFRKLQLQRLVFSTAANWDWKKHFQRVKTAPSAKGFGATARRAHTPLAASPGLRELEIANYVPADEGERQPQQSSTTSTRRRTSGCLVSCRRNRLWTKRSSVTTFSKPVAQCCPELQRLAPP